MTKEGPSFQKIECLLQVIRVFEELFQLEKLVPHSFSGLFRLSEDGVLNLVSQAHPLNAFCGVFNARRFLAGSSGLGGSLSQLQQKQSTLIPGCAAPNPVPLALEERAALLQLVGCCQNRSPSADAKERDCQSVYVHLVERVEEGPAPPPKLLRQGIFL